jgi:hypothetical protein
MERVRLEDPPKQRKTIQSRLNEELISDIASLVERGLPPESAGNYLRIPPPCYWNWLRKGEHYINNDLHPKKDKLCGELALAVKEAFAKYLKKTIDGLAGKHNFLWRREMAILERRDKRNWSIREQPGGSQEEYDPDERFL